MQRSLELEFIDCSDPVESTSPDFQLKINIHNTNINKNKRVFLLTIHIRLKA